MNKLSPLGVCEFLVLFSGWWLGLSAPLHAQPEPFYRGKTITFVVGVSPAALMTSGPGLSPLI